MTVQWPLVLIGLLALPLLGAWYLGAQSNRRRAAAAFASAPLMASIAPRQPGWRRHAPAIVMAIALALLIVAAARPEKTVAVPVEQASVMLMTDVSGSMQATDIAPTRLRAARAAALRFVQSLPSRVNVGVIEFNQRATVLQSPTLSRGAVRAALDRMRSSGGTATGDAIASALRILTSGVAPGARRPPAAIVLLSDGKSTSGPSPLGPARDARRLHIPIYTVALGTPQGTIQVRRFRNRTVLETQHVPPDPQSLGQIASASGASTYSVTDAGGLATVYQHLGSQLGHRKVKQEITSSVAGAALAMVLLGVTLSLAWFGRLI